jgi:hypothetical protein
VGSETLAAEYVEQSGDVYMARGHLAPKADFMYTSWQVIISLKVYLAKSYGGPFFITESEI